VMTTWEIRKYGAGSDVNVLLLFPPGVQPEEALDRVAEALQSKALIASAAVVHHPHGPTLHLRMFAGLHFGLSVARGKGDFDLQIAQRDFMSQSLSARPGLRPVIIVLKNFLLSLNLDVHGLASHQLYDYALKFWNELGMVFRGCDNYGSCLVLLLSYLIELSQSTVGLLSKFDAAAEGLGVTVGNASRLARALDGLRNKIFEAAESCVSSGTLWRKRLLERVVGEAAKDILFCESLRSSVGHLPNCMNPADRFTPELRRVYSDVTIPKHLGKSIYWMGLGEIDDDFLARIEKNALKLHVQLQWFPSNNSRFFTHEPKNKLAEQASLALDKWIADLREERRFDRGAASEFLNSRWEAATESCMNSDRDSDACEDGDDTWPEIVSPPQGGKEEDATGDTVADAEAGLVRDFLASASLRTVEADIVAHGHSPLHGLQDDDDDDDPFSSSC